VEKLTKRSKPHASNLLNLANKENSSTSVNEQEINKIKENYFKDRFNSVLYSKFDWV